MENVFLQGDGGSLTSFQPIGNTSTMPKQPFMPSITSTGPLGDVTVLGALPSVKAPSIFGSLIASGGIPATSIIQTTGIRTDPITGALSLVPADFGRVYVAPAKKGTVVTTSVVQASGTLDGKVISRGNFISLVEPSGNFTGLVAAQGNIGAFFTPSGGTTMRLGGVIVGNPNSGRTFSGQMIALGKRYRRCHHQRPLGRRSHGGPRLVPRQCDDRRIDRQQQRHRLGRVNRKHHLRHEAD